jgi:hypothetical protein
MKQFFFSILLALVSSSAFAISELKISEFQYDFGVVDAGGNYERTFWITNVGDQTAIEMDSKLPSVNGFNYRRGEYPGIGGTCWRTLAVGASCTIIIQFRPPTVKTFFSEDIRILYRDQKSGIPLSMDLYLQGSTR